MSDAVKDCGTRIMRVPVALPASASVFTATKPKVTAPANGTAARGWKEVGTKGDLSPICEKLDWCCTFESGWMCCNRRDAEVPGYRLVRRDGENGKHGNRFAPDDATDGDDKLSAEECAELHERFTTATDEVLAELAEALGLEPAAARHIGTGWDAATEHWTFPERDGSRAIIGFSTRTRTGVKRILKRSRRGLVIPDTLPDDGPVLIVEGASDVIAALGVGLVAVGRPSNTGGVEHLGALFADAPRGERIVVGENDQKPDGTWPGRGGAEAGCADWVPTRRVQGLARVGAWGATAE